MPPRTRAQRESLSENRNIEQANNEEVLEEVFLERNDQSESYESVNEVNYDQNIAVNNNLTQIEFEKKIANIFKAEIDLVANSTQRGGLKANQIQQLDQHFQLQVMLQVLKLEDEELACKLVVSRFGSDFIHSLNSYMVESGENVSFLKDFKKLEKTLMSMSSLADDPREEIKNFVDGTIMREHSQSFSMFIEEFCKRALRLFVDEVNSKSILEILEIIFVKTIRNKSLETQIPKQTSKRGSQFTSLDAWKRNVIQIHNGLTSKDKIDDKKNVYPSINTISYKRTQMNERSPRPDKKRKLLNSNNFGSSFDTKTWCCFIDVVHRPSSSTSIDQKKRWQKERARFHNRCDKCGDVSHKDGCNHPSTIVKNLLTRSDCPEWFTKSKNYEYINTKQIYNIYNDYIEINKVRYDDKISIEDSAMKHIVEAENLVNSVIHDRFAFDVADILIDNIDQYHHSIQYERAEVDNIVSNTNTMLNNCNYNNNNLLFATIQVEDQLLNQKSTKCLIDSGANINVINKKIITQLQISPIVDPSLNKVCLANGETIIAKNCMLNFNIDDQKFSQEFKVLDNLQYDGILGLPFLNSLKDHNISFQNQSITYIDQSCNSKKLELDTQDIDLYELLNMTIDEAKNTLTHLHVAACKKFYKTVNMSTNNSMKDNTMSFVNNILGSHINSTHERATKLLNSPEFDKLRAPVDGPPKDDDHKGLRHKVILREGYAPIQQKLRSRSFNDKATIKNLVNKLLEKNLIYKNDDSEWSSNVVLVNQTKPGSDEKKFRLCFDYTDVNKMTVMGKFPMPNVESILSDIGSTKPVVFSSIDLKSGYHQVLLDQLSRECSTFITNEGKYSFRVAPFGLVGCPRTFQTALVKALHKYVGKCCEVFIDDVIIYSASHEQHLVDLRNVCTALMQDNWKINVEKSMQLGLEKIETLGHTLSASGIGPQQSKVEAILNYERPVNKKQLKGFVQLVGFYRKFIKDFAERSKLLNDATHNDQPKNIVWNDEQIAQFEDLKLCLTTAPILAPPIPIGRFIVYTDASPFSVGAVLMQEQKDTKSGEIITPVISYFSKKLTDCETRYAQHEREFLALKYSLDRWTNYVSNQKTLVYTDSNFVKYLKSKTDNTGRLSRWQLWLSLFGNDIEFEHIPGERNISDPLSRRPNDEKDFEESKSNRLNSLYLNDPVNHLIPQEDNDRSDTQKGKLQLNSLIRNLAISRVNSKKDLYTFQQTNIKDKECEILQLNSINHTNEKWPLQSPIDNVGSSSIEVGFNDNLLNKIKEHYDNDKRIKKLLNKKETSDQIHKDIDNGLLYRKTKQNGLRLLIPNNEEVYKMIMQEEHDSLFGGHLGEKKIFPRLNEAFDATGLINYAKEHLANCEKCQLNKSSNQKQSGLLKPLDICNRPFERIHVDICGPLIRTSNGNRFVLVFVDAFSKAAFAFPFPEMPNALTVADVFIREMLMHHGMEFKQIYSDRGAQFAGEFMYQLCQRLGIQRTLTTSFHPNSNGQVERYNRTFVPMLRSFVNIRGSDWDKYLHILTYTYNAHPHVIHKLPPLQILTGSTSNKISILNNKTFAKQAIEKGIVKSTGYKSFEQYWDKLENMWKICHKALLDNVDNAQKYYNKRRKETKLKEGDLIKLTRKSMNLQDPDGAKKLGPLFWGPLRVIRVLKNDCYKLHLPSWCRINNTFHISKLRKWNYKKINEEIEEHKENEVVDTNLSIQGDILGIQNEPSNLDQ